MKFIIGKKIDMAQVWRGDEVVGVTRVQAGPCTVVTAKSKEKDGYEALQLGFGEKKEKHVNKPQKNAKNQVLNTKNYFRYLKEFRLDKNEKNIEIKVKSGDVIDVGTFAIGDTIKVTGISKGKGFQGVVKRHGFHGHPTTHGTKDSVRMPGSIGATGPQHVLKGKRMGGHMGDAKITTTNLEIVGIDNENNILLIKGSVPGARNGLVLISGEGELKIAEKENIKTEEVKSEIAKVESTPEKKEEEKKEEISAGEKEKK